MSATPALRSLVSYASEATNKIKDNISKIQKNVNGTTAKIKKEEEKNQKLQVDNTAYESFLERYLDAFPTEDSFEKILNELYKCGSEECSGNIEYERFDTNSQMDDIPISCVKASLEYLYKRIDNNDFSQRIRVSSYVREDYRFFLGTIYYDSRFLKNPYGYSGAKDYESGDSQVSSCVKVGKRDKKKIHIENERIPSHKIKKYFFVYLESLQWTKTYENKITEEDAYDKSEKEDYIKTNEGQFDYETLQKKFWFDVPDAYNLGGYVVKGGMKKKTQYKKTRKNRRTPKRKRKTK